jgi:hypothetical protein
MNTKETTMDPDTNLFNTVFDHLEHLPQVKCGIDTDDPWVVVYSEGYCDPEDPRHWECKVPYYREEHLYLEHRDHRHQPDYGLRVFVNHDVFRPHADYALLHCWRTDPSQPCPTYQECRQFLAPLFPNLAFTDEGYCWVEPRPGKTPPWYIGIYFPRDDDTPPHPGTQIGRNMILSLANPAKSKALQHYAAHREQHPLPPNWTEEFRWDWVPNRSRSEPRMAQSLEPGLSCVTEYLRKLNHVHLENETYFCDLWLPEDYELSAILWVSQKQDHYPNLTDEDALSLIKLLVDDRVSQIIHELDPERPSRSSQDRPALQNFSFSYPPTSQSSLNLSEGKMTTPLFIAAYCHVPEGPEVDQQAARKAQENTIIRIIERWKDEGFQVNSKAICCEFGTNAMNLYRPGLQNLHSVITKGIVDIVIYHSIERLSKSSEVYIDLKNFLEQNGAAWIMLREHDIVAAFYQTERKRERERRST